MARFRSTIAITSGIVCIASASFAQDAGGPVSGQAVAANTSLPGTAPSTAGVSVQANPAGATADANATPGAPAPAADKPTMVGTGEWEETWTPWNTGGEHADLGFSFFGHLGLGYRANDSSTGPVDAPNGLRVGITGIFRPIRYFGFGLGYEHADLERTRIDTNQTEFRNIFRDLNTLWIDARAYPVRFDPFAMYVGIAGGPSFQSVDSDGVIIDPNTASSSRVNKCSGSDPVGMGMKAAVGAELALVSGAILWADVGPDYYLLSDGNLDGCDVGAGDAFLFGFRAGIAIGFEKTKVEKQAAAPEAPKDADRDGITDDVDACPSIAGVADPDPKKHGCPPDQDGDGFIDSIDACPTEPGVADPDPKKNGCPPPKDKDADGITDELDACPEIAGVADPDPKKNGCPPDTDGDGFRDDQDACPEEKGVDDADPSKRGCPKLVRVTDKEIIILEQVQFDTGRATIRKESDELLNSVADVLKEHPEILKIEIQGHTDNRGSKALNSKLSDDRAKSVLKALEKRGVEAARLSAKGYGPDQPVADNKTDEGRQKNRRVQFVVTEKKARPVKLLPMPAAAPATPPGATPADPAAAPAAAPAPAAKP